MERKSNQRIFRKTINRVFSYFLLIIGIFSLSFSLSKIYEYVQVSKENDALNYKLVEIRQENDRLRLLNAKLDDDSFLSFYVKDGFQYDGSNIVRINKG